MELGSGVLVVSGKHALVASVIIMVLDIINGFAEYMFGLVYRLYISVCHVSISKT